ncbi:tail fiber assembly protein [Pseudomonas sp. NPDC089534]|uniref:tail fiber assembly protein n=1 Tax=Pseudomonas sp. NPDC089534 TaxID=3364468 RepID=UPI003826149F
MYNYLIDRSGALIGPVEFTPVPGLGVQLPDNAVTLNLELSPAPNGFAWAHINGALQQQPDFRGDVYRTETGTRETWTALGALPEGYTTLPWPGGFHVWDDGAWRIDDEARLVDLAKTTLTRRDTLLRDAVLRIAPLQYAVDIGDASAEEQQRLLDWKRYSVALNRIDRQAGFPDGIDWPAMPGTSSGN